MNLHEFIFSNQTIHRVRRHVICWLIWWTFIIATVFFTTAPETVQSNRLPPFYQHQPGLKELGYLSYCLLVLLKSFLLILVHLFFCYASIYILLPAFRLNKNYWLLVFGILLASALTIPMGYFLYSMLYPSLDQLFSLHLPKPDRFVVFRSIDASLVNAIKVTLISLAIALLKRWWLKQKEKEKLENEKINAEVELLKAQIHPAFLFSTLNNIISHARMASPKAPEMLIKLSDLLSYMLYECEAPSVELEKEIGMVKAYMALEKIRQGERVEMTLQINGNCEGKRISPLILLPFIDNSFSYSNNQLVEQAWVNLDITINGKSLSMKLINGKPPGLAYDSENVEHSFANVEKRLRHLYPGRHDLKINAEQELLMVHLNLTLEEPIVANKTAVEPIKPALSYAGV